MEISFNAKEQAILKNLADQKTLIDNKIKEAVASFAASRDLDLTGCDVLLSEDLSTLAIEKNSVIPS